MNKSTMKPKHFINILSRPMLSVLTIGLFFSFSGISQAKTLVDTPRCEYLANPLGIDTPNPRLSWVMTSDQRGEKQTAYQVLVASSAEALAKDTGDLWDSGKVASDQSIHVAYAGKPLISRQQCWWKVRLWDGRGQASPWSKPASWSMGLLKPEDWQAKWIGGPNLPTEKDKQLVSLPAYYLRKEFTLPAGIRRATAWVCGLGFFELQLNGRKIGDHLMDPALSLYPRRAFYVTFDVTQEVVSGANVVGVVLGSGRYYFKRSSKNFGFPRLLLQLEVEHQDGAVTRVVSDESWSFTDQGPIRANQEYDGETYDARMEMAGWDRPGFNGSGWVPAEIQPPTKSLLQAQMIEPMRITERLKPVSVTPSPNPGAWLVDFGQNFYGNVKLRVSGKAGDQVSMTGSYSLGKDGKLLTIMNRKAKCTDTYTVKGNGVEEWHPVFVGRGFRRIEVKGFPGTPDAGNFEGLAIQSDLEPRGAFECSDAIINQIHRNYLWTARSYLRSVPMDPDRDERQGWTGDTAKAPESQLWDLGVASFYGKWLDDHRYEVAAGGRLPAVIPSFQNWSGDVLWPATAVLIPETLYDYYGDSSALGRNYAMIKAFVDSGHARKNTEGVIPTASFSDWCDASAMAPVRKRAVQNGTSRRYECGATPAGLLSTAYQYHHEQIMVRFATLLGKSEDATLYRQRAQATLTAYNAAYLDPATGIYQASTQTGQMLPLMFDMVPKENRDRVIAALIDDIMIARQGHFSVGLIGTQWLMQALTKIGRPDVAYVLATQTTKPSWGYMVKKGATSIWERWDGDTGDAAMNSEMLLMLAGNLNAWFYQTLAGINPVPESPGFKKILIHPQPVGDLTWVKAHHDSPYGRIESNWTKQGDRFNLEVLIPPNTTASVVLPDATTQEVGPGSHHFTCKWTPFVPPATAMESAPAKALEATEGYIANWLISGPHYQGVTAKALMDTAFPPELPDQPSAWLHYDARQARGPRVLQLGKVFDGFEHATYLKTILKAGAEIPAHLEITTKAPVKVWLHGALVSAKTSETNKQVYEVTLRAGDNTLMIKTLQMKADTLELSVRLSAPAGKELRGVSARAK